MKITKLETFLVKPRWLFLKVHTNAGIVGLGEPIVEGRALDLRRGRQGDRAVPGRQGPAPGGPPLAGDLPPRLLPRRPDPDQRPERHRHGALGHQGQGPRRAGLRAARRPDAATRSASTPTPARPERIEGSARAGLHRVQDPAGQPPPRALRRDAGRSPLRRRERSPSCARPPATTSTSPSTSTAPISPATGQAADQGARAVPADVHRGAVPGPEPRRHGRDRPRHAPADRHRRARLHQVGLPRGAGEEGRDDPAARPLPRRRHHRGAG